MDILLNSTTTEYLQYVEETTSLNYDENSSRCNATEHPEDHYHYGKDFLVPITVLYLAMFLIGFFGNLSICIIIILNRFMHTCTNYFLLNLAVSNTAILVLGLLPELYAIWYSGYHASNHQFHTISNITACIILNYVLEIAMIATILTIMAIAIDRYMAIFHPSRSFLITTNYKVKMFNVIIWIVAVCLSIPEYFKTSYLCCDRREFIVTVYNMFRYSESLRSIIIFVVPLAFVSVLYVATKLKETMFTDISKETRIMTMLGIFVICWLPHHILLVIERADILNKQQRHRHHEFDVNVIFYHITIVMFYLFAVINPLLSIIRSRKFRKAFKITFSLKKSDPTMPSTPNNDSVRIPSNETRL